jgi:hypothetical protein
MPLAVMVEQRDGGRSLGRSTAKSPRIQRHPDDKRIVRPVSLHRASAAVAATAAWPSRPSAPLLVGGSIPLGIGKGRRGWRGRAVPSVSLAISRRRAN